MGVIFSKGHKNEDITKSNTYLLFSLKKKDNNIYYSYEYMLIIIIYNFLTMVNVLDKWINEIGQDFFKKNLGIRSGQKILDFGSGWGGNAIAISKIVAPNGYVYAFEKDRDSINKMLRVADGSSKKNLKVIIAKEKIRTPIPDSELDVALLYDVIHDSYFNSLERKILFREMSRIVKRRGMLSVFPHHISSGEIEIIKKELSDAGFEYSNKITSTIIHDSILILDSVYNFIKN